MNAAARLHVPSRETFLFALLVGPYLLVSLERGLAALVVLALGGYWFLDVLPVWSDAARRRILFAKWTLVVLSITVTAIVPTTLAMMLRSRTAPYEFVHDGVIQNEAAVRFVQAGKNPYVENYHNTPMAQWPFREGELTVNPALSHYVYMPLTFLLPLPFQALADSIWGWFDQRVVYLLLFMGVLWLVGKIVTQPSRRLMLMMMLGLNPLFVVFFILGRNDVLTLFWLTLVIHLLQRGRVGWSAVALACACATKQLAWFFLPFYLMYVSGAGVFAQRLERISKPFALLSLVFLSIVLPWALADPGAFLADVWAYTSGLSSSGYPITGYGFSTILLSFGLVKSNTALFPFWIVQAGLGLPLLWMLLRRQAKVNSLSISVASYALLLFVVLFFSRAFNDNYLGFIVSMLALATFVDDPVSDTALVGEGARE